MEHIAALLLIVGCSPDYSACKEIPAPTPIYETMGECQGQLPFSLQDMTGKAQKVLASCVFVDPAGEEQDAQLNWDVKADGKLVAAVTFDTPAPVDPVLTSGIAAESPKSSSLQ